MGTLVELDGQRAVQGRARRRVQGDAVVRQPPLLRRAGCRAGDDDLLAVGAPRVTSHGRSRVRIRRVAGVGGGELVRPDSVGRLRRVAHGPIRGVAAPCAQRIARLRLRAADADQLATIAEREADGIQVRHHRNPRLAADREHGIAEPLAPHVGDAVQLAFNVVRDGAFVAGRAFDVQKLL